MAFVKTRAYGSWAHMKERCQNPRCKDYPNYGGRGITVCKRWQKFENFVNDMGEPLPGFSLDRRNNSGNYQKSNCRWATRHEQNNNQRLRRDAMYYKGRLVKEWAKEWGIPNRNASARIVYYLSRGIT